MGWKEISDIFRGSIKCGNDTEDSEIYNAADFEKGVELTDIKVSVTEHYTAPPKHFTEDLFSKR